MTLSGTELINQTMTLYEEKKNQIINTAVVCSLELGHSISRWILTGSFSTGQVPATGGNLFNELIVFVLLLFP